jgi:hypothetical protein
VRLRTNSKKPSSPKAALNGPRIFRGSLIIASVVLLLGLMVLATQPAWVQRVVVKLESRWGGTLYGYDRSFAEEVSILIGSYLRESQDLAELPELVIDVPFKEMRKIYKKREEALERGNLIQGEDDFVKAEIRVGGNSVPVKLRLKGDWNDHLAGRKWSFRIHVRNGEQLFGMRRFSIQSPATRGFQSEPMFYEALKNYDIMSPRYSFVNVTINGEAIGIMALEEFFSKELLEYNRRREGVIIRFDESLVWASRDGYIDRHVGWRGAFDYFGNASVDAFASGKIQESAYLTGQYEIAVGLLRGFVQGRLPASKVFDAQQFGQFFAVADLFGAWHATSWSNMRFYLNPVTMRLEPIVFDATLQDHYEANESLINDELFVQKIMSDAAVMSAYQQTLVELTDTVRSGELQQQVGQIEEDVLPLLRSEFRLLSSFPLDYLEPRLDALLDRFVNDGANPEQELYYLWELEKEFYSSLAHVRLIDGDSGPLVEIDNAIPRDAELIGLQWVNSDSGESRPVGKVDLPMAIPARGFGSEALRWRIALDSVPEGEAWQLQAKVRLLGRPWSRTMTAYRSYEALDASPIPVVSLQELQRRYRFIRQTDDPKVLQIGAGRWRLTDSLIIPAGYSLQVESGAVLQFARDALMIVNGPLQVAGTPVQGVVFEALDGVSWPGLFVNNANELSVVSNLTVRNTSGVTVGGWALTGGVNFYESDVEITGCRFENSLGEDALNIIHSEFTIRDTVIKGTASDAFDADFSSGLVVDSRFEEIGKAGGGDAVDVSGSKIEVTGSSFFTVSDKALSVGERSEMTATDIKMNDVGTAAAAKDGSVLRLSNTRINGAAFAGLTAYIKKPEYGPASIEAENVEFNSVATPVLVQTDNVVKLDGELVETQDVDVDALYDTIMRKGLKR